MALIGILAWKYRNFTQFFKSASRLFLVLLIVESFSKGSRLGAIFILIWFFLIYVRDPKRQNVIKLALSIPSAIVFSNYMVWCRAQQFHGLLPQLSYLGHFPWFNWVEWFSTNVGSYSFNISAYAGFLAPKLPSSYFWTSVNPLPGFMTNWYQIAPSLRFNFYAPYTSIGELQNYGPFFFIVYFSILGYLIGSASFMLIDQKDFGNSMIPAGVFGTAILALAFSLEYNLRSTSRFILFSFFLLAPFKYRNINLNKRRT